MKPFLILVKRALLAGAAAGLLASAGGCQSEPSKINGPHQDPQRVQGRDGSKDITGPHQH